MSNDAYDPNIAQALADSVPYTDVVERSTQRAIRRASSAEPPQNPPSPQRSKSRKRGHQPDRSVSPQGPRNARALPATPTAQRSPETTPTKKAAPAPR